MTNFIEIYDNCMPHEECNQIVLWMNEGEMIPGEVGINGEVRKEYKDCWEPDAPLIFSNNSLPSRLIKESLISATKKYVDTHNQLSRVAYWEPEMGYNLQKYDPGQCYHGLHCENADNNTRMLVWMLYLNTVTEGGGTRFDNFDMTVDAVEGRMVIWPPYWTHFHQGVVSNTQTKYIATGWYSFFDDK